MIVVMGGASSSSSSKSSEHKSSIRPSVAGQKLPMPDHNELEKRFAAVLASMNLPPDKARLLKSYDDERKWDLVCDKERVSAKDSPESYINKLRLYFDPLSSKDTKNLKNLVGNTLSTKMLKELEISLRTNNIEWVHSFLCEENNGLDVLVDYLTLTQEDMRCEQQESNVDRRTSSVGDLNTGRAHSMLFTQNSMQSLTLTRNSKRYPSRRQTTSKVHFGDAMDDVHVCIMCLRAIMNHQNGFNLVFGHKQAINCIALSLNHRNFRTKTLVLELLAAICLVSGGHEMILTAFDNFKKVCGETHRFETLMRHFQNLDDFHIDFMVACMQFINIIVHSVQEMNFRVHLQHEFTLLGLDDFLERLKNTESDCLPVQVHAYLDNMIDVQLLLEDSDTKSAALLRVEELGDLLSHANERIQELDEIYLSKTAQMQEQLSEVTNDRDRLAELCEQLKEETPQARKSLCLADSVIDVPSSALIDEGPETVDLPPPPPPSAPVPVAPPPPPAPPAAAPPPPPFPGAPTGFTSVPPPPLLPGFPGAPVISIKKSIQPKYRLPILNWIAMKPNDVKGTMFSEIDDEKLYDVIDFNQFEDIFKLGNLSFVDADIDSVRKAPAKKEKLSLLESNRLRNVAITRRKIEMLDSEIVKSINGLDLKALSLECVEILLRIIPNEQEVKAFKEYEKEKKPIDHLADEDRFMINLMKIERIATKLQIMSYIGNFFDTCHHLSPQLQAVFSASKSIRNSVKVQKLFEIILAFGNYMNGCKRGGVYGFKLQSLDMLSEMKSSDKKTSLLQFIVKTIQEKFPSLANFDVDFDYAEKAATVSLENVIGDIAELKRGMEMTKREYEQRKDRDPPVILKDFLANSEEKLHRLNVDAKNAQEAYSKVVEYFGENPKMTAASTFFSMFVRFCKAYKQSEIDLETTARLEREALISKTAAKNKKTVKESRDAVVNELQHRQRQVLNRDEINDGTLDDLINNIKSNPYRRADAMHRSMRRAADTNVRPIAQKCAC